MSNTLLFYIGLAIAGIIFVIIRHNSTEAVAGRKLGATDGAGDVAAVLFFFVVVTVLIFLGSMGGE
jgi:hypothetical protein